MDSQASRIPLIAWVAAISLIVSCAIGVTVLMGWIPTSFGKHEALVLAKSGQPGAQAPDPRTRDREKVRDLERDKIRDTMRRAPTPVAAASRCTGCGVVQSVRQVKIEKRVESASSYEITVDLDDGTNRVIIQADAPAWRSGDRVRIVNGVIESKA